MHSQSELLRRITEGLKKGIELVESTPEEFQSLRVYLLLNELQFALTWLDDFCPDRLFKFTERIPDAAGLFRNCAELARKSESHFPPEEFDRLAHDASWLISELDALEGQAQ